ncbi:MAG: SGNH/GDSL hydrolase family protein [Lysobacter sp.]|nr:SGNH/GDSL hydrolase family protein [Lysobacter sp.]
MAAAVVSGLTAAAVSMSIASISAATTGASANADAASAGSDEMPAMTARISYLALGDSYTIGEGVAPEGRWPAQLAAALRERGIAIDDPRIVARTGWTTDELSAAIDAEFGGAHARSESDGVDRDGSDGDEAARDEQHRDEKNRHEKTLEHRSREARPTFGLVTLLIGVNNQYRVRSVDDYGEQFEALLERAIGFADGRADRTLVLAIPDWGVTPFAAQSGRDTARIAHELDAYNTAARAICERRGVAFVDIAPISRARGAEEKMLVNDGLHPSVAMYALWSDVALPVATHLLRNDPR